MKQSWWFGFAVPLFSVTLALAANPSQPGQGKENDAGEAGVVWGGSDVQMQMNATGATLEFDCAHGAVLQPVKPDSNGQFSAAGTYTPERGGPIMKDNPPRDLPAVYKGSISGDTMQLQVVFEDKTQQPPAFTLMRGNPGRVRKCR